MIVYINGEQQETEKGNLADLLSGISGLPATFALAVNGKVVPRSKHKEFVLNEGDKIEIFALMAGG